MTPIADPVRSAAPDPRIASPNGASARRPPCPAARSVRWAVAWLLVLLSALPVGEAGSWTMRVCGYPDAMPFSNDEEAGFENRIAEILADELHADLDYVWWPQNATLVSTQLGEGTCDLIMGVPDGYEELLTTVAYYRSPYVFVHRADAPFDVASLDDPGLGELAIGVQNAGIPPHDALVRRGLAENIVLAPARHEGLGRTIDAVAHGEIDLALAWGPVAGHYAAQASTPLEIVPVEPQFDPPFLSMVRPMTIGVRPGDEALRDRLNRALAARWSEVQNVLTSYGVPLVATPAPLLATGAEEDRARVGMVGPTRLGVSTRRAALYEVVGEAARRGALTAEGVLGDDEFGLDVLTASSPGAGAARRAAERLVATERVDVLVGGLGQGQAEVIADVAEARGVPFLNIGSASPALRNPACASTTFHVEASARMYLDALVAWFAEEEGHDRLFVVHEEGEAGAPLHHRAVEAVERSPAATLVGAAPVVAGQPIYRDAFAAAREAGAEGIVLLLGPADQIAFLAQLESADLDVAVAPFPFAVTQTRDYLATVRHRTDRGGFRAALWETTLTDAGADDLNDRFASRWGAPMDPSAWAAYQAVAVAYETIRATRGATGADAFATHVLDEDVVFDVGKGDPVFFRASDRQLVQPLYVVEIDPEAPYGARVEQQIAVARHVHTIDAVTSPDGAAPASPTDAAEPCPVNGAR